MDSDYIYKFDPNMKFPKPELDWIDKILGRRKTLFECHIDAMAAAMTADIDKEILDNIVKVAKQ